MLIEDKVDAPLQPEQAKGYRLRAEQDRKAGTYDDYEILLCAPRFYIDNHSDDLTGFDHLIPLERVAEIIRSIKDTRAEYRASFLETAGTRHINKWLREDDPATNEFWSNAYELAIREFPQLEMKRVNKAKGVPWFTFRPHDFPTQPKYIYLSLKGDRGYIDLTFSRTKVHLFQPAILQCLNSDMSVHQAGGSAAIRIETQGFKIAAGFVAELPRIRAAFEASSRLIAFYRDARVRLDQAAKAATPT